MVPWTMDPFLSSICTVSFVSFMRNLQIIHPDSRHSRRGHERAWQAECIIKTEKL